MSRCAEKGCPNFATFGEKCVNHKGLSDKPVLPDKDFEIVFTSEVPAVVIRNERNYRAAKAIEALQDGHALKVRQNGHPTTWAKTIMDLCRKLGIKNTHSRKHLGSVYFWKEKVPGPGRRRELER